MLSLRKCFHPRLKILDLELTFLTAFRHSTTLMALMPALSPEPAKWLGNVTYLETTTLNQDLNDRGNMLFDLEGTIRQIESQEKQKKKKHILVTTTRLWGGSY